MSARFDVGEVDRHDERLRHALPVRLARVDPAFRWKDATQSLPTAVGMSTCPVYPEILSRVGAVSPPGLSITKKEGQQRSFKLPSVRRLARSLAKASPDFVRAQCQTASEILQQSSQFGYLHL